jgi:thiosulfate/3-mercaptopyruvate sulfurtransferase
VDTAVPARRPGDFVARPRPEMAGDAARVLAAIGDPAVRMLDARGPERYRGEVEPIDAVAGHVPGAINHPFPASVGADGRFLPVAELRAAFLRDLGGIAPDATIAMCGSGVTACHLLLAMEHAGLGGAKLYPGSWSEWSRDPARPVARGAEP